MHDNLAKKLKRRALPSGRKLVSKLRVGKKYATPFVKGTKAAVGLDHRKHRCQRCNKWHY